MDYSNVLRNICGIAQFSIFLPLLIGIIGYRKLSKVFKWLILSLLILASIGIVGYVLSLRGENNILYLHLYVLVEGWLLGLVYYQLLNQKKYKIGLITFLATLTVISFITNGSSERIYQINNSDRIVASLLFLYCGAIGFYIEQKDKSGKHHNRLFWLNASIFTYGLNTLTFTVILSVLLQSPNAPILEIWALYSLLMTVYYIMMTIAIWKDKQVPIVG